LIWTKYIPYSNNDDNWLATQEYCHGSDPRETRLAEEIYW